MAPAPLIIVLLIVATSHSSIVMIEFNQHA